jgi:hypothetical protein
MSTVETLDGTTDVGVTSERAGEGPTNAQVILAAVVSIAIAAPLCLQPVWDTDAGWHVAVGRLIREGHFPHANALSWTAPGHPWYPTSWLFDLFAAVSADALPGTLGLQLLTLAFMAGFAFVLARACAKEDREWGAWLVPAITILLATRIVPRPHVASWVALALALWLGPASTRARSLCVIALVIAGNLHSGAAFGSFVLALYCLEAYWRTRRPVELVLAAACGLALIANPGAFFNLRYLDEHLHVGEVVRLTEFDRPTLLQQPVFWALLPISLGLAIRRARERPALLAATIVFAVLGLRADRMTFEFEIVAAPTLASGISWLREHSGRRAAVLAAAVFLVACGVSRRVDRWPVGLHLSPTWDAHRQPVRAARFIAEHGLSGPHFNSFSDGGYLEYALPNVPAFLDGRVQAYPPELLHELEQAERTRADFDRFLRSRGVQWAVTTRIRERLGGYRLLEPQGWALVYWDDINEVWLRRDIPSLDRLARELEYRHLRPYGQIVGNVAALPAGELPVLWAELDRFEKTSPADPFALVVRCAAAHRMSRADASGVCEAAYRHAPSPPVRALVDKAVALRP